MHNSKKLTRKVISLLMAVIMLVSVMAVGFTASAATVFIDGSDPAPWSSTQNYTQGSKVSYNGNIYQANFYSNAGTLPTDTSTWTLVGACQYERFGGDDGSVKLDSVRLIAKATTGHNYIGFGLADNAAGDNGLLRNPDSLGNERVQYLEPNKSYIVYLIACPPWYYGSMADKCALITVNENGSVRMEATGFGYNGLTECTTLNYRINPAMGGFTIEYVETAQKVQEIYAADMQIPDGVTLYGVGVDDGTLEQWSEIGVNVGAGRGTTGTMKEGGDRQGFHVNYLEDMVVLLGTPARTVCDAFNQEALDYYAEEKAKNAKYMEHYTYSGSEYYLHDVYCQGVWDTMPAVYGWQQDENTEPGLIIKTQYPQIEGMSYGLAAGGQNPWVLCDYLERNANLVDGETGEITRAATGAGEGWYYGYDEVSEVPYLWNPEYGIFLGYENAESLTARCEYINETGLAGCIIWELSGDNTDTYPMISLMDQQLNSDKKILGYFTNWSVYNQYHQYQKPEDLPLDMIDFVNYSFFQVGGYYERGIEAPANCLNSMDRWADDYTGVDAQEKAPNMIPKFSELKQTYPNFKLLISVGGWTRGDGFNAMVNDASNRATFVNSVKEFLTKYPQFDGIDLDWEYAGSDRFPDFDDPNDLGSPGNEDLNFSTYTALCTELRTMLNANFPTRNYLTACSPAAPSNAIKQDLKNVAEQCTFINMMTYDYHGAFDPTIGYNSPLYAHPQTPDEWSTENSVKFYEEMGVPLSKINIGTPFYSRGWAGVKADVDGNPQPLLDPTPIFPSSTVYASSIEVTPETARLDIGKQVTATATISPENTTEKDITWSSDNEAVATVDQNGVITAVSEGTATITATVEAAFGTTLSDTCVVTVNPKGYIVFKIDCDKAYHSFYSLTDCPQPFKIVNGKGFVPVRLASLAVGKEVSYDGDTDSIVVYCDTYNVRFKCGNSVVECLDKETGAVVGSADFGADNAARYINGKAYLPVRVMSIVTGVDMYYVENNSGEFIIFGTAALNASELEAAIAKANPALTIKK